MKKEQKHSLALAVLSIAQIYAPKEKKLTKKEIWKLAKDFSKFEDKERCSVCGDLKCSCPF